MKILLAGRWKYEMYEQAWSISLQKLGHTVVPFSLENFFGTLVGRIERKWTLSGYYTRALNRRFVEVVRDSNPDVVILWKNTHIWASTIVKIKRQFPGIFWISYNHDDFSGPTHGVEVPLHHRSMWRHFLSSADLHDLHLVKRQWNILHLRSIGVERAEVFGMYYVPDLHRPVELTSAEKARFESDVVFVGHYEPDGRDEAMKALSEAGLHVRLFGGKYWHRSRTVDIQRVFGEVRPVYGDDYARALCGARICLCFLSKLNRDSYTRRCFEIPACGRLLLSERSRRLTEIFVENREAVFFSTVDELIRKARWLLNHPAEIESIARRGRERIVSQECSVDDRMRQLVDLIEDLR